jgi:hypothetical protein
MRKIKKASAKGCVETKILSCSETLINQRDVLDLSNAGYNITIYKVDDHNFTCSVTWILIHEGKAGHIRYYGFTKEEMDEIKMYYYGRKRTVLDYAMVDGSVSHNCLSIL